MSIHFLIGPSGSGKTQRCCAEITAACAADPLGAPIIYLVPEQGTYEAEKTLLECGDLAGFTRAQVLSFQRLAEFVFAQVPAPKRPRLSRVHRDVLTKLLVTRLKAHTADSLVSAEGIEEALAEFISEAKEQALTAEQLGRAATALRRMSERDSAYPPGLLATKLTILEGLLNSYQEIVSGRFEDPQDTLVNLSDLIVKGDLFQGAQVYVDGFISFTPIEERLLVALARKCTRTTIALLGERESLQSMEPRPAIFRVMRERYERLTRIFSENNLPAASSELLSAPAGGRYTSAAISELEKSFLSPAQTTTELCAGIEMWLADNPRDEARLAAETVSRLMQSEGLAPGDIAILARDLESSADAVSEMLTTLKIPFFIDRAAPLETHPLVVGIQSLIRCVLFPANAEVRIALGKSGMLAIDRRHVDRLEHHVLQYPRTMREWYSNEPWKSPPSRVAPDDDEPHGDDSVPMPPAIDAARRRILAVINSFSSRLFAASRTEGTLGHFVSTLCQAIDEAVRARGLIEEDEQILSRIGELLAAAAESASDQVLPWSEAGELVLTCLQQLTLPRIPPMLDQLFVGQVDRSRLPRLKAVILTGLNEGSFPRVGTNQTLLNDRERELLNELGYDFKPGTRQQFNREALFAYRAISAPSSRLILTRSRTDSNGAETSSSPYWRDVAARFTKLTITVAEPFDSANRAWRAREIAASILRCVDGTHDALVAPSSSIDVVFAACRDAAMYVEGIAVRLAATWRNTAALPPERLAQFMKNRLLASASRLESFAHCPFQHFVRSILRPQELVSPSFERTDAGIYAHSVLRNFTRMLRENNLLTAAMNESEIRALLVAAKARPYAHIQATGLLSLESEKFIFHKLDAFIEELATWLKSAFETIPYDPIAEEISLTEGQAIGLHVYRPEPPADGWDYEIRGQIDRVDQHRGDQKDFVIVDYKLKKMQFDFSRWNGGDSLQLPLYMLAVEKASPGNRIAGALYLNIVPEKQADDEKEKAHRYRGVFRSSVLRSIFVEPDWSKLMPIEGASGDPDVAPRKSGTAITDTQFDALLNRTREMVNIAGREIISGRIDVAPARYGTETACGYCSYRPVCMVDFRVNSPRTKVKLDRVSVLTGLAAQQ